MSSTEVLMSGKREEIMFNLLSKKLTPEISCIIMRQLSLKELLDFGLSDSLITLIKGTAQIKQWLKNESNLMDSECQDIVERPMGEGLVPWFASVSLQEFKFLHSHFRSEVLAALNHTPDWQNYAINISFPDYTYFGACKSLLAYFDRLDLIQYLCKNETDPLFIDPADDSNQSLFACALTGNDTIMKFFLNLESTFIDESLVDACAFSGRLDMIKNAVEYCGSSLEASTDAIDDAAARGFLDVVQYLHEFRDEGATCRAINEAATYGHLNVVRYLHEQGYDATCDAINGASEQGHLNTVRYLLDNCNDGFSPLALDNAAKSGNEQILILLLNAGGCATSDGIDFAARNGHMKVLEILHEHGAQATKLAVDLAAVNSHHAVVEYLLNNRTEGHSIRAVEAARAKDDVRMLILLSV